MDNVFIKSSGVKKLWEPVSGLMKNAELWDKVIIEHANASAKHINGDRTIPYALLQHQEYSNGVAEVRLMMQKDLWKFSEFYSRINYIDQNFYNNKNIHDVESLFNILIQHYYKVFKSNNISLFLLTRPYHVGQDFVAYRVAKLLGIKTLIMFNLQHIFPNRFIQIFNNEDFGDFKTSVNAPDHLENVFLKTQFEKKLDYMETFYRKRKGFLGRLREMEITNLVYEAFRSKKLSLAYSKYRANINYDQMVQVREKEIVDFECNFIYFPLHLQPEMTTSNWGGTYSDQALALEHLAEILPSGWKIFVKENPKQRAYQRGQYFFKRLDALKCVELVDRSMSTYELLRNCKAVATITGTAGWEAITGGKPVIYFGQGVWYKKFDGAFEFDFSLDIKELCDYKINHTKVEESFNTLKNKTLEGRIYNFEGLYNKEEIKNNASSVFSSLTWCLYSKRVALET